MTAVMPWGALPEAVRVAFVGAVMPPRVVPTVGGHASYVPAAE